MIIPKALVVVTSMAVAASSAEMIYTTPNLDATPPGKSKEVSVDGVRYANKGLVGVGQLSAGALDGRGDTLGSFSSFKIDPKTWHRKADGSFGGALFCLPDRGFNLHGLVDYPARLQRLELTFRPDYGQAQVTIPNLSLVFKETIPLRDFRGKVTTGLDPRDTALQGHAPVPVRHGKFAVDAEGLGLHPDGTFYISEEYGPVIYHVAADGRILGLLTPPQALLPRFAGKEFDGFTTQPAAVAVQTGGRRDNQGYEGLDVTPDGRYLAVMMQSALRQDCTSDGHQDWAFARLLVYDLVGTPWPSPPIEHYLVRLPTYNSAGDGGPVNRTAAQSELVALNRHTFLMLARDGHGNGSGRSAYAPTAGAVGYAAHPMVFKSVLLLDTKGATNLAGTPYETGYEPATRGTGATLSPVAGLTAAQGVEFVNFLNPGQLARFGLDLNVVGAAGTAQAGADRHVGKLSPASLSEKWEAMTVVSCLDPAWPDDYFLFVGNDNDFLTAEGRMLGKAYQALSAEPGKETVENLNRVLVYRITLPGYAAPGR